MPKPRVHRGTTGWSTRDEARQGVLLLESRPLPPQHDRPQGSLGTGNGTQRVVTMATPKKRDPSLCGSARATGGSGQGLFCRIILHTHSDTRVLLLNLFETCFP